jgi:DNA-binding transcriptional LysR family regulator
MDTRQLRNFVVAADLGSITLAAERLFMSQSALSREIQSLERGLGVTLLERRRGSRRLRLTHAGDVFLRRARTVLAELDETQTVMEEIRNGSVTDLSVAAGLNPMRYVVLPALTRFKAQRPNLRVQLIEPDYGSELSLVERGNADVAIGNRSSDLRDVRWETLYVAHVYALVSPSHVLAAREFVEVDELAQQDLLLFKGGLTAQMTHDFLLHIDRVLPINGLLPRAVFESRVMESVLAAAEMGLGVAVLSDTVPFAPYRLRAVPVLYKGRQLQQERVVAWRRQGRASRVVTEFIAALKEQARNRVTDGYARWSPERSSMPAAD